MSGLNIRLAGRAALTAVACLWLFALSPASSYAKEWRGVTPARSTRDDVVRLFGQCSDPKAPCAFSSDDGDVYMVFSSAVVDSHPCAAQLPTDPVLLIEVSPKAKLRASDFGFDEATSKKLTSQSFPDYQVYADDEAGLLVRAVRGRVQTASYIAAAQDRQNCPTYYDSIESSQFPLCVLPPLPPPPPRMVLAYGSSVVAGDEEAALDKFAAALRDEPSAQAYVIAYAGRKSRAGEAQARAKRVKTYLMSKHGMEDGRVVVVDGGYREDATVELFTVPVGATPPSLAPTLDPKDVQIVPDKKTKKPTSR